MEMIGGTAMSNENKTLSRKLYFDEGGQLHTGNLSSYWIPELTVCEVIHGTVYTATGSYEGEESFVKKLERITARQLSENRETSYEE